MEWQTLDTAQNDGKDVDLWVFDPITGGPSTGVRFVDCRLVFDRSGAEVVDAQLGDGTALGAYHRLCFTHWMRVHAPKAPQ